MLTSRRSRWFAASGEVSEVGEFGERGIGVLEPEFQHLT